MPVIGVTSSWYKHDLGIWLGLYATFIFSIISPVCLLPGMYTLTIHVHCTCSTMAYIGSQKGGPWMYGWSLVDPLIPPLMLNDIMHHRLYTAGLQFQVWHLCENVHHIFQNYFWNVTCLYVIKMEPVIALIYLWNMSIIQTVTNTLPVTHPHIKTYPPKSPRG